MIDSSCTYSLSEVSDVLSHLLVTSFTLALIQGLSRSVWVFAHQSSYYGVNLWLLTGYTYAVFALTSTFTLTSATLFDASNRLLLSPRDGGSIIVTGHTLDYGSQILWVINKGNTEEFSLTGPTTLITTVTLDGKSSDAILTGSDRRDLHCNQTGNLSRSKHYLTYAEFYTVLTDHQIITQTFEAGVIENEYGHETTSTFTGPSTVYITYTTVLIQFYGRNPPLREVEAPGAVCGGSCDYCGLYFVTVYVYYWPVPSPNTVCQSSIDSYSVQSSSFLNGTVF